MQDDVSLVKWLDKAQSLSFSRRRMIQLAGLGALSMAGADFLAACNSSGTTPTQNGATTTTQLGGSRQLTPYFLGYNDVPIHSPSWTDSSFASAAAQLKPATIRYPGGTVGNYWDWQKGGFVPQARNQQLNTPIAPYRLQELQTGLHATGATPVFMLNMLTSDLNYQLEMLRTAKSMGIPVQFVELGNEYYLKTQDYVNKFPTAQDYGTAATTWIQAIRQEFPGVKISAVGSIGGGSGQNDQRQNNWNKDVLQTLKGNDAMTIHVYAAIKLSGDSKGKNKTGGNGNNTTISSTDSINIANQVGGLLYTRLNNLTQTVQGLPSNTELWFTEYNIIDRTNQADIAYAWIHGIYATAMTLSLLEQSQSYLVCFFEMVGQTGFETIYYGQGLKRNSGVSLPTYGLTASGYTMSLLADAMKGMQSAAPINFGSNSTVQSSSNASFPALQGWSFTDGSRHQGFIVNRSSSSYTWNVQSTFPQGTQYQQLYASPLAIITSQGNLTAKSGSLPGQLVLPPYSVTELK